MHRFSFFGRSSKNSSNNNEKVIEGNENNSEQILINLKIFNLNGESIMLSLTPNDTGLDVKKMAIKTFNEQQENNSSNISDSQIDLLCTQYKLVKINAADSKFDETLTLTALNIVNGDQFVLSWRALQSANKPADVTAITASTTASPTQKDIDLATNNRKTSPLNENSLNVNEWILKQDLRIDLKNLFIALAKSAAYVIGSGPLASRLIALLKQSLLNKKMQSANNIQCLTDMGFSNEKAAFALQIKNNTYSAALDWLIDNPSVSDLDVRNPSLDIINKTYEDNILDNIEILLEIIRLHSQTCIEPSTDLVNVIMEMGFSKRDVLAALKKSGNHGGLACEYLCDNQHSNSDEKKLTVDKKNSTQSPIVQHLLSSSDVQMQLANPDNFIMYLTFLENFSRTGKFSAEAGKSEFMGNIIRSFHEEKHVIIINQFS